MHLYVFKKCKLRDNSFAMELKELRKSKKLTQAQAAKSLGVSLRSYKDYENDEKKKRTFKYEYLVETLNSLYYIGEEHGILEMSDLKKIVSNVLSNYNVNFCYLFGSYARGEATDASDVDLIIDTEVTGLAFYGLVEDLRTALHKKVDLLKLNQLDGNETLLRNVMKEGIKIYG